MGISIRANVDKSQDVNSGSLMQIIKMAGSENSVVQTGRMDDNGKDIGKENQFFNVLKEKFALLLQSDQSDNASRSKTSQYISLLEKLGQDAENLSGDMLSMMALLNLPVPDDGTIMNEVDISDILSKLISGEMSAGEIMESFNGNGNQVPLTSKENKLIPAAGLVKGPNADEQKILSNTNKLNSQSNGINEIMKTLISAAEADTEECQTSTSLYSGLDSIKNDEAPSNLLRKEAEKNRLAAVSIDQGTFADPRGKETTGVPAEQEDQNVSKSFDEIKLKETSTTDTQKSSDSKFGELLVNKGQQLPESSKDAIEKFTQKIISEGQNNVQQTKNNQAEAVTEKSANDHQQNILLNSNTTSSAQDNKDRLKMSADVKTNNQNAVTLSEQHILDDRSTKNASDGEDSHWAGKEQDKTFADLQRTVAGKSNAAVSEYDNLMEKVRTDVKGKTVNAEKNLEGHSLAASELSAATSSKAKDGDVSPSQIINRVTAALNEKMLGDGGRVKITLTPPSLGTLEMDVMVQNSKVRVLLTAENQEVQKILSGNLDLLKGSLQNQGLTIERCDVMMQDRREQYSQGSFQQTFTQENSHGRQNADNQTFKQNSQTIETQVKMPKNHHTVWRSGNISIFA